MIQREILQKEMIKMFREKYVKEEIMKVIDIIHMMNGKRAEWKYL